MRGGQAARAISQENRTPPTPPPRQPVTSGDCGEGAVVFHKLVQNATSAARQTDANVLVKHIHQRGPARLWHPSRALKKYLDRGPKPHGEELVVYLEFPHGRLPYLMLELFPTV